MQKYEIPARYFHELIDGTEMDLTEHGTRRSRSCISTAIGSRASSGLSVSTSGASTRRTGRRLSTAEDCGLAFQLTNILRDVRGGCGAGPHLSSPGRPAAASALSEEDLRARRDERQFPELMRFEAERAKGILRARRRLIPLVHPPGRPTLTIMMKIYRGILDSIERNNYDVHSRRARVSTPRKLGIVAGAWLKSRLVMEQPITLCLQ